jgi:hypothetical protein
MEQVDEQREVRWERDRFHRMSGLSGDGKCWRGVGVKGLGGGAVCETQCASRQMLDRVQGATSAYLFLRDAVQSANTKGHLARANHSTASAS